MLLTEFIESGADHVRERLPEDEPAPEILIFGLEGEMFFGASVSLEHHLERIEHRLTERTKVVVLRMKRARNPDAVGLAALEGLIGRVQAHGVHVLLCGVRAEMQQALKRCGLLSKLEAGQVFLEQPVRQTSTQAAMRRARQLCGAEDELNAAS